MGVSELVQTVFSGLSPLVMEHVVGEGERIVVRARTSLDTAVCPVSRVVVRGRVRRLVCPTRGCRHTFREQVPGVLERYQRAPLV